MHVARLEADPVHGGQVADRVADVGVADQLRLGGGARGEVEQQRVARPGDPVRRRTRPAPRRVLVAVPPAVAEPPWRRPDSGAERRRGSSRPGRRRTSAICAASAITCRTLPRVDPVRQVGGLQQRRGGDDDRAELHRREHHLPQRDDVAEHQQHVVAAPHPEAAQPVRHLAGPGRHGRVADRLVRPVVADHPQREPVRVLGGDHVEPVERPVELVQRRPGEAGRGRGVVGPVGEQQVARRAERAG